MSKELFMAAHEEEIAEYMEANPDATWEEAYDRTADKAYDRMVDMISDRGDR